MANDNKYYYGVGRRKRSTARAKYYPTTSDLKITVNKKPAEEYFQDFYLRILQNAATAIGITKGRIDFYINGGGIMGQAEAARLAMAKSLLASDEGHRTLLRMYGFLSTDIRKVLPKRPGLRKNRKREQWSKR